MQNPHAVSIVTFLTQVMPRGDHLRGQPGGQPGLCSFWQLTACGQSCTTHAAVCGNAHTHTHTHAHTAAAAHVLPVSCQCLSLCEHCELTLQWHQAVKRLKSHAMGVDLTAWGFQKNFLMVKVASCIMVQVERTMQQCLHGYTQFHLLLGVRDISNE